MYYSLALKAKINFNYQEGFRMKDFFAIVTNEETICVRKDSIYGYRFDNNLRLTLDPKKILRELR